MTPGERMAAEEQFNRGGSLLLATDAAAEGLNLHARCRAVVHFELPWSPCRLEQRTGRVNRIGQSRVVHEIMLVAADTAERLVLAPLASRAARASRTGSNGFSLLDTL
jgi:SNF2 family DNA or RNA helicase